MLPTRMQLLVAEVAVSAEAVDLWRRQEGTQLSAFGWQNCDYWQYTLPSPIVGDAERN